MHCFILKLRSIEAITQTYCIIQLTSLLYKLMNTILRHFKLANTYPDSLSCISIAIASSADIPDRALSTTSWSFLKCLPIKGFPFFVSTSTTFFSICDRYLAQKSNFAQQNAIHSSHMYYKEHRIEMKYESTFRLISYSVQPLRQLST